jgi:hypothetical protein
MQSQAYSGPMLDLLSYARRGPGRRDHLSPGEIQQVARTVRRTPEVMVKVLPTSASTRAAVRKHLEYISRKGDLDLETDDGETLQGTNDAKDLVEDWDLDLDENRRKSDLTGTRGREPARLVHKVIFSMPAGTQPEKVLTAVKNFAREEFALKHRYAMALHTDTPRPHIHVVIKAVSEQGQRLHIRKATLREWRSEFARHLRAVGVAANATPRYVRGATNLRKPDGIYRASLRGESTFMRERERIALELARGDVPLQTSDSKLAATRIKVQRAWAAVSDILLKDGQPELAMQVRSFAENMPLALTEKQVLAQQILANTRESRDAKQHFRSR